jgi:hypothetical protein
MVGNGGVDAGGSPWKGFSNPTWKKLTLGTALQRAGRPVQQAKLDPGTHRELQLAVMSTIVVLGVLTSLENTLADIGEEGVAVAE